MTKPPNMFWFLPTSGDGSYLGTEKGHRPADISYRRDIAMESDRLGFGDTLLPTGINCLEEACRAAQLLFPVLGIGQRVFKPGRDFRAAPIGIAAE